MRTSICQLMRDVISINNLKLATSVGSDRFRNIAVEPIKLDINCRTNIQKDLDKSINYADLTDSLNKVCQHKYDSLPALSSAISSAAFSYQGVEALNLRLSKSKGLLKGELSYEENHNNGECVSITKISNIDVDIIIGIHPWERQFKQKVLLDLTIKGNYDYNLLIQRLVEVRYPFSLLHISS